MPHHFRDARGIYEIWAAAADVVVHHSEYGRRLMQAEYTYGPHARHVVIPHGHWGERIRRFRPKGGKAEAEAALGLEPAAIRIGVIGAPRREKDVQLVLDAMHASHRDDVQLCVWSLAGETVPDDPRIVAYPYTMVDQAVYAQRLFALDALLMPFEGGMLTTGTVGDALGAGLPTLASSWEYLRESLGSAAIPYGETVDDLTRCIDGLSREQLDAAAAATASGRASADWSVIAEATLAVLDEVVGGR
ncbi:MAG: hypothetical protein R2695_16235 [Acidimicrobiales bacterium]